MTTIDDLQIQAIDEILSQLSIKELNALDRLDFIDLGAADIIGVRGSDDFWSIYVYHRYGDIRTLDQA